MSAVSVSPWRATLGVPGEVTPDLARLAGLAHHIPTPRRFEKAQIVVAGDNAVGAVLQGVATAKAVRRILN